MMKLLLEAGADKDRTDNGGSTALHCAASTGHLEVVKLLVEARSGRSSWQIANGLSWAQELYLGHKQQRLTCGVRWHCIKYSMLEGGSKRELGTLPELNVLFVFWFTMKYLLTVNMWGQLV